MTPDRSEDLKEKVARAMFEKANGVPWDSITGYSKEIYLSMAESAIEVIENEKDKVHRN